MNVKIEKKIGENIDFPIFSVVYGVLLRNLILLDGEIEIVFHNGGNLSIFLSRKIDSEKGSGKTVHCSYCKWVLLKTAIQRDGSLPYGPPGWIIVSARTPCNNKNILMEGLFLECNCS